MLSTPDQEQETPRSSSKQGVARFIPSRKMIALVVGVLMIALLIGIVTRNIPPFIPFCTLYV